MQLLSFEKKRRLHFCYPKTGISLLFDFQYVKWHTIESHIMWCINNPIGYAYIVAVASKDETQLMKLLVQKSGAYIIQVTIVS